MNQRDAVCSRQDYCIFTLGSEVSEPHLATIFNHLYAEPSHLQTCPEVLLVFHRHSLRDNLEFLPAHAEHISDIAALMSPASEINEKHLIGDTKENRTAATIVAECEGSVVGTLKVVELEEPTGFEEDFHLQEFLLKDGISSADSRPARVDLLLMNPIFLHR